MRIVVDRNRCTGLGVCESMVPDMFEVREDGQLALHHETVPEGQLEDVEEAVASCPTEALRIEACDQLRSAT